MAGFADKIIDSLNNASEHWSTGANHFVESTNSDINNNFLGWVNTTTGAINDTLNVFVSGTSDVLNQTFGGTVLYQPITEVLNCLIGLKIAGFQKALDWVSDHAHVDFPTMPNNTFTLGALADLASDGPTNSSFLSSPGSTASDDISAAVLRFTTDIENAIRTEALIATCVLLIWVIIVLIGVVRALALWYGRDKLRAEGGTGDLPVEPRDGFHDIPLGPVLRHEDRGPAPEYSAAVKVTNPFRSSEDEYHDQKLGFAGQRDYDSSLRREATRSGHSRVSSHAEVWSDQKR